MRALQMDGVIAPNEEVIDLSNDGIQEAEHLFTINDFSIEQKGEGERGVFVLSAEELPFPVTLREWLKHPTETAQRIGRGKIKQLVVAATGQPRLAHGLIVGAKLLATTADDGRGFMTLKKFKPAPSEA